MRVYLDCCCLQRPFDDQTQPRIKVEAEAVLAILACAEAGQIQLLNSAALEYEVYRNPEPQRRGDVAATLMLAAEKLELTDDVESLAESLESQGIAPMDAVHVAFASQARADYFVTCDDRLLRRCRSITGLECQVASVLALVQEIEK